MIRWLRYGGLAIVFAWFFVGGITHFTNTPFFLAIVPPYVPMPLAAVYVSGVCEIAFALGILYPPTRQWSGNLLILLTIAVTPANVYMWQHPDLFPSVSPTFLSARLVVQVGLIALIWWSTRNPRPAAAAVAPTAAAS